MQDCNVPETPFAYGKTKKLYRMKHLPGVCRVRSLDTITAKDGQKRANLPRKGILSTQTTCNVFELLARKGIPVAYVGRCQEPDEFFTLECDMVPVEVVVRCVATGSYCKRNPNVLDGTRLDPVVMEFFLKTTNCKFGNQTFLCDDPIMVWDGTNIKWKLYRPDVPISKDSCIGVVSHGATDIQAFRDYIPRIKEIAAAATFTLVNAWRGVEGLFKDVKYEFGIKQNDESRIVLADVVDVDSARVDWNGVSISKQPYRDNDPACLEKMMEIYELGAALTDRFAYL